MLAVNVARHGRETKIILAVDTDQGRIILNGESVTIFIDGEQCLWEEEVDERGRRRQTIRARAAAGISR